MDLKIFVILVLIIAFWLFQKSYKKKELMSGGYDLKHPRPYEGTYA